MEQHTQNWPLTREAVIELLHACGIQPTQQRVEIAQILFSRPQHVSADQVLAAVNGDGRCVSKATVYNTLGLFAAKGLVREIIADPSRVFYDSNTSPHHHFYNIDTGRLTDILENELAIGGLPDLPQGTSPDGVEVIVRVRQSSP